jgi:uncharacterized protein (UPF0179 family)
VVAKGHNVIYCGGPASCEECAKAPYVCPSALMIKGEHYPCDAMTNMVEGSRSHEGWAHSNKDAEAIWGEYPNGAQH